MPFGAGRNWAAYSPEELAEKKRRQAEICRRNNLRRSKEMRTRIAREMGQSNKGRKPTPEEVAKRTAWQKDPVKMAKHKAKQRLITMEANRKDPELARKRREAIRGKSGRYYKKTANEEDWWARNYKVSKHRRKVSALDRQLNTIGLAIPKMNVSDEYLGEVEEFFAEVF